MWKQYFEITYPRLHVIPFSTHTELKHVEDEFTKKHKRLKKGKLSHRYLGARGGAGLIQAILELAFPEDDDEPILTEEEIEQFEYKPPEPEDENEVSYHYQPPPDSSVSGVDQNTSEEATAEGDVTQIEEQEGVDDEGSEENEESVEESEEDSEQFPHDHRTLDEVEKESMDNQKKKTRKYRVIGMIGHPNVGKSYVIC